MKFGRNILFFSLLICLLGGAILLTHRLHIEPALIPGQPLFPVAPETITSIEWQVPTAKGSPLTITCRRAGDAWRIARPYGNAYAASETLADILDAVTSLRVRSYLGSPGQADFAPTGTLRVQTADASFQADVGSVLPMNPAQQLVAMDELLVTTDAAALARLPKAPAALRTRALLPGATPRIRALEWRVPGQAFTRAQRMAGGAWSVAQPFPFEVKASDAEAALAPLRDAKAITAYVLPADDATPDSEGMIATGLTSETLLASYGLDEESATRVLIYLQDLNDAFVLRFGKADPEHPGNVFCLLDGYRAIVSVSAKILDAFGEEGPFAPHVNDRPITGDIGPVLHLTLRTHEAAEAPMELVLTNGTWVITSPAKLPADSHVTETFLREARALTGDFIAISPPPPNTRLCDVDFVTAEATHTLSVFEETDRTVLLYRKDQQRLYRVEKSHLPTVLTDLSFGQTFVDKTVMSLSAASIQRIEVERQPKRRNGSVFRAAVERSPDALVWQTVFPAGSYVSPTVIDAWLTCFAEMKAEAILQETEENPLQKPFIKVTLDLNGGTDGLRRILLVGEPSSEGSAPAMIQGRPILYRLDARTVQLLMESPVVAEEVLR